MTEDLLVAEAEVAIREALGEAASAPSEVEARLRATNRLLDGPIVGVALLRLLRQGTIELTDDYFFALAPVSATRPALV